MSGRYVLTLAKEDFKFSAAHFTLFPDGRAERLHGHDYRLRVRLTAESLGRGGLVADIAAVKRHIRALCARLDERVLLPGRSPALDLNPVGDHIEVHLAARRYRFPSDEVLQLDVENVTIELLAHFAWRELAALLGGDGGALTLAVDVEETAGQSCRYEARLGSGC